MTDAAPVQRRLRSWLEDVTAADVGTGIVHVGMIGSLAAVGYLWGYAAAARQFAALTIRNVRLDPGWGEPAVMVSMVVIVIGLAIEQTADGRLGEIAARRDDSDERGSDS